jgi:hypothetical protein
VSLSPSLSSTFIHLHFALIFPLLHWHTRSSGSNYLSPSSPCSFSFLSNIPLVSCTLPCHPFCLQILPLSFPLSLSAYSSCTLPSLCNLAFLSTSSCFFYPQISALYIIILLLKSPLHFLLFPKHIPRPYLPSSTISLICALSVALSLNV